MRKFAVRISESAQEDIYRVIDYISQVYKAPLTAEKYLIDLYDIIFSLQTLAESIQISTKSDILKYGFNARSITFKKLTIIFTSESDKVIVQAVISGAIVRS